MASEKWPSSRSSTSCSEVLCRIHPGGSCRYLLIFKIFLSKNRVCHSLGTSTYVLTFLFFLSFFLLITSFMSIGRWGRTEHWRKHIRHGMGMKELEWDYANMPDKYHVQRSLTKPAFCFEIFKWVNENLSRPFKRYVCLLAPTSNYVGTWRLARWLLRKYVYEAVVNRK